MFELQTSCPTSASISTTVPSEPEFLVVGYGSVLHGDDGVGPWIADLVAGLEWPGVRCLALTQLTPELAEEISRVKAVAFVDASVLIPPGRIQVERLAPTPVDFLDSHRCLPRTVMHLARVLFGHQPESWMVSIGVSDLGMGQKLSPAVTKARATILRELDILRRWARDDSSDS
jgi:hydrogenase maturation protease